MKRTLAPVLTLLLLATSSALAAKQLDRDLESLDAANRALEGRRAIVELNDGVSLPDVRDVSIGPDITTWEAAGERQQVATSEVKRVSLAKRSRVHKWSRRGLLVGALFGSIGGGYSEADGVFVKPLDASDIATGAVTGAAVGAAAGALAGGKVVYEAGADDATSTD